MSTNKPIRKLRLGMVGGGITGHIGVAHRISFNMHNLYDLVAGAFSSNPATAHESAKVLGVAAERSYESYEEMAAKEAQREDGIEAVAIVTPNDLHVGPAIAFAKQGIDIICDKPLSDTYDKALELEKVIKGSEVEFILTHNYTGYPLVRQAKEMIENGAIGKLRQVRICYLQDGALKKRDPNTWKGNPERCGPAGTIADIGSHAYHMLRFVTGVDITSIATELRSHSEDRVLDDHSESLLRFNNDAIGSMTCSQISIGKKCELNFGIYGDTGSLHWGQEEPNEMIYCEFGNPKQVLQRGMPYLGLGGTPASNIPAGHTEGYYEAFAQIYRDAHSLITARRDKQPVDELARKFAPNIDDGMVVARYINASVQSAKNNSAWVDLDSINA